MPKSAVTSTFLALRLYVAGDAPNSLSAVANIKAICDAHFPDAHKIEIVDMLENPLRALEDGVLVTPTLLRVAPQPTRRVIGNLNDRAQVQRMLASQ
jgi:circadian clock protein KaiB